MMMNEALVANKGKPKNEPVPQEQERSNVYREGLRF